MATPALPANPQTRWVAIATTLVVAASFAGFLIGTSRSAKSSAASARHAEFPRELVAKAHGIVPAMRYEALPGNRRGPNAAWTSDVAALAADATRVGRSEPATAEEVAAAVEARAERRAYDGAPPVIPHRVDARDAASCVACHDGGLKSAQIRAPAMSHRFLSQCTQCHVEQTGQPANLAAGDRALPVEPRAAVASGFVGEASPLGGARAFPGAPPTMPHRTAMRERCDSCHGPSALPGLQTSHLDRQSCGQCHASSAALDLRVDGAGGPPALLREWAP